MGLAGRSREGVGAPSTRAATAGAATYPAAVSVAAALAASVAPPLLLERVRVKLAVGLRTMRFRFRWAAVH